MTRVPVETIPNIFRLLQEPDQQSTPKLTDLSEETVAHYRSLASRNQLVMFNPKGTEVDSNGMVVYPVVLATVRLSEPDTVRIVVDEADLELAYAVTKGSDAIFWMGQLSGTDKAKAAVPGSEFRGWKRTKQYRLSDEELDDLIAGRIFIFGGLDLF